MLRTARRTTWSRLVNGQTAGTVRWRGQDALSGAQRLTLETAVAPPASNLLPRCSYGGTVPLSRQAPKKRKAKAVEAEAEAPETRASDRACLTIKKGTRQPDRSEANVRCLGLWLFSRTTEWTSASWALRETPPAIYHQRERS